VVEYLPSKHKALSSNSIDGKMRPVETIPALGEEGMKNNNGGCKFNYDIL
jgi:hypothetical protein